MTIHVGAFQVIFFLAGVGLYQASKAYLSKRRRTQRNGTVTCRPPLPGSNIRKRISPNGVVRYEARWRNTETGKNHQKSFRTLEEAEEFQARRTNRSPARKEVSST